MYVNDGKYIPYPLILWVMFYPTIVPWPSTVFFWNNIDDFCITPIEPRVMFFFLFWDFFVKQFLFEKRCRWNCETPAAFLFGEVPLMIFGRDDSSFPVFEAFAAFFWIVNIPMSCWIEPRKRRRTNMGALAIHQNETSPPKMGRLNLPPIHSDS